MSLSLRRKGNNKYVDKMFQVADLRKYVQEPAKLIDKRALTGFIIYFLKRIVDQEKRQKRLGLKYLNQNEVAKGRLG